MPIKKLDFGLARTCHHYHGGWVVGLGCRPVADVAEVVEEEEPDHPEEAADNEHHHHQARVQGAVHLQRKSNIGQN